MKKLYAVLLIVCLVFACGCRENELISVPVFIGRFNKVSDGKIDKKNLCAVEEEDTLIYSFLLDDNLLLTLKSQKESGRIKQCSVTALNKNTDEESFFEKCREVIIAYEKCDKNHAENVLRDFSFKNKEFSAKDGFYRLDFLINDAAVYFCICSSRLNPEKTTDLKLYEQTYS